MKNPEFGDDGKALDAKDAYASKHVLPRWIKLFIDGTVEGGKDEMRNTKTGSYLCNSRNR